MMSRAFESLEDRICFSATLTDGTLMVEGSAANDVIRVTVRGGDFVVNERGAAAQSFAASEVQRVVVNSLDGNDRIRVDRTVVPTGIDAGSGTYCRTV